MNANIYFYLCLMHIHLTIDPANKSVRRFPMSPCVDLTCEVCIRIEKRLSQKCLIVVA